MVIKNRIENLTAVERRRYPRVNGRFVVSYQPLGPDAKFDITQAKNISQGGLLLTSSRPFEKDTNLALRIRLPSMQEPIEPFGRVVESREVIKGVVYDTRLAFSVLSDADRRMMVEALDSYRKMLG